MLNDNNNNLDNQLLFILKTRRLIWIDIQTRHKGEKNAYRRKMTISKSNNTLIYGVLTKLYEEIYQANNLLSIRGKALRAYIFKKR